MLRTKNKRTASISFWILAMVLGTGLMGVSDSAWADDKAEEKETARAEPCHWRLLWMKDPTTCARIAWNTSGKGKSHQLRWRKKGETEFQKGDATNGLFSYGDKIKDEQGVPLTAYYHQVDLEGLTPNTKYEVECVSDGKASRTFYFITAPDQGPFSLIFGGDSRTGRKARRKMNRFTAELIAKSESAEDPADRVIGIMHGGDFAEVGTNLQMWIGWMADHEHLVSEGGRLIPLIPTRGNHDRGRLFNECFGFDSKDTRNYYSVSFGSMLRVVTLNTETSIAGDQAIWLRKELKDAVPKHRWVVPQYHRPGYAAVKIPGGALAHWVPIFEKFNIRLVCEADGHVIKRTLPIRSGKHDETGVVYVGEGGMGVGQRTPKKKRWFLQEPGMCDRGHHIMRLRFTDEQLTYECITPDETEPKVIDRWEFVANP